jgi:hypothetical protein
LREFLDLQFTANSCIPVQIRDQGLSLKETTMAKQGRYAILFVFLIAFFNFVAVTAQAQTTRRSAD